MPSGSPDASLSDWDHVERPQPEPTLPVYSRARPQQLGAPATMSAVEQHDTSTSRRRGSTQPSIAPSADQYGPIDDLSTADESKRKLGRQGGEAEKWAALLPKQPTRPATAQGRIRPGMAGVVRWTGRPDARSSSQVDVIRLNSDLIPLAVYSILALLTRLWQIGKSNTVVWDEAHFGKFGAVRWP